MARPLHSLSSLLLLTAALAITACAAERPIDEPTPTPPAAADGGNRGSEPDGGGGANPGNPDGPIVGGPGQVQPPLPDGALPVQPEPGIVDARPHAWDRISVAPDGRTITIYYWGGVQDCYGLAAVDVARDASGLLQVTVFEGQRGNLGPNTACIEIALLKAVTVELDELIVAPAD